MNHLAANLYASNLDVEIFDILIDQDIKPKNWEESHVKSFWIGMDFGIVIYNPTNTEDRFQMYYFVDVLSNREAIEYLAAIFKELSNVDYFVYKKAQNQLLDVIYMLPTYRAIYGKKLYGNQESTLNLNL